MMAMKYSLIIDDKEEESIIITAHQKNELRVEIEKLIKQNDISLIGYDDNKLVPINLNEVYSFYTKNSKVYAMMKNENYLIRERIYQVLELSDERFIKINQGCLVNINKISRFEASIGGAIKVVLKNGFSDYIARRELQNVKRRLGL